MFRHLFKRYLTLFLSVFMLATAFSGCSDDRGNTELDTKNPVTIVVWHYYHGSQKSAFDSAVKEFNDTLGYEKGIIVEAISHGGVNELADNVIAAANGELDAGTMPDIFGSYGDTALVILHMGLAAPIDDYISAEELAEYEESFIHEGKIGTDRLYVFPIAKSTESLMINKTDFDTFAEALEASGLGETVSYDDLSTWEGLLRVSDIYYRFNEFMYGEGKAFMGIDVLANYLIVGSKQLGQDLISIEDGSPVINLDRDIMAKLWSTYYEPMVTGRFSRLGRFCSDDIKTGDTLCFIGSTASAGYFPTELLPDDGEPRDIEMLVLPMPIFENGDKIAVSQGAGMVIVKSDELREYASAIFLKWFTESERNVPFALNSSYLPVKTDALDEQLLNSVFETMDTGDIGLQNSAKALKVGLDQIRDYTLYSSEVFDGSAAFRIKLPAALDNAVREDRESYLNLIAQGTTPDEAYAEIKDSSLLKFEEWLDSLRA